MFWKKWIFLKNVRKMFILWFSKISLKIIESWIITLKLFWLQKSKFGFTNFYFNVPNIYLNFSITFFYENFMHFVQIIDNPVFFIHPVYIFTKSQCCWCRVLRLKDILPFNHTNTYDRLDNKQILLNNFLKTDSQNHLSRVDNEGGF